jgi:hypothetical protein
MNVMVNARIRHFGLVDAEQAKDPRRGYTLGLLLLDGRISEAQHDAGLQYGEDMSRWFGLCVGQFPSIHAQNLFAVAGVADESDSQVDAAIHARATMLALKQVLYADADIVTARCIESTVRNVCLLDLAMDWPMWRLRWLKSGLNALANHYSL